VRWGRRNAALLCRRAGDDGQVVTVEVDPRIADAARVALSNAGYHPEVVTADGLHGCPARAPYDRVISTAAVRDVVPPAWLEQLSSGGRLVTPWDTDWHGVLLTLHVGENGDATGRFHSDLGLYAYPLSAGSAILLATRQQHDQASTAQHHRVSRH